MLRYECLPIGLPLETSARTRQLTLWPWALHPLWGNNRPVNGISTDNYAMRLCENDAATAILMKVQRAATMEDLYELPSSYVPSALPKRARIDVSR